MSHYSQSIRSCGQPSQKRPKLDIGRQINVSSPVKPTQNESSSEDMYDELWGDELDMAALEKVDFDETQALSQMPKNSEHTQRCLPSESSASNRPIQIANKHLSVNVTKNSPKVPLRRVASSGWPTANTFSPNISLTANKNITSNHASLEQVLLENNSLKEELTRKNGEVSLIRSRLHNVEQEFDKQKKGYTDKMEAMKKEADRNSANLSKEIKSLKGQLEVKTMEMETSERRIQHNISSLNKLNSESPSSRGKLRPTFSPARVSSRQSQKEDQLMSRHGQIKSKLHNFSLDLLKQLVTPELVKPTQLHPPIQTVPHISCSSSLSLGPSIPNHSISFQGQSLVKSCQPSTSHVNPSTIDYEQSFKTSTLKSFDKLPISDGNSSRDLFYSAVSSVTSLSSVLGNASCPSVEPCSLSLLSPRLLDINSENTQQVISQVTKSCVQTLFEMLQQLNSTFLPTQKRSLERCKKIPLPVAMDVTQTVDLLCHKELYNNERGICARRALALQSLLVEFSIFAAELILPSSAMEKVENKSNEKNMSNEPKSTSTSTKDSHQMLTIVKDIFHQFNIRNIQMCEGIVSAVMALLRSLLQADLSLSHQSQDLIVHILQEAASCRLVLYNTLQVFLAATKYSHITARLCCNNSDKCIPQALCTQILVSETPMKHYLSDLFTSWALTLFYGKGLTSPSWLFSVPANTCCQCRPMISRLCLAMLGEACSVFPTAQISEKPLVEEVLKRGVLLVPTLLYHDEHFGTNVDPASDGYYDLFIWSMKKFSETQGIKLNSAYREILESLCIQENLRKPAFSAVNSEATNQKCDTLLTSQLFDDIQYKNVLDYF